ncbi:MAG: hypothetical protein WC046_06875 [Candidatus Bathyarchaeia archaeon]
MDTSSPTNQWYNTPKPNSSKTRQENTCVYAVSHISWFAGSAGTIRDQHDTGLSVTTNDRHPR